MIATSDREPGNLLKSHQHYSPAISFNSISRGFTLVELIIVIFIISMTAALIMPSLWDTGERALKAESRRISNTLRYIYDEALGKKQTYNLKINLDKDVWSYKSKNESRSFELKDRVMFKDIIVPSLGDVSLGEVIMAFGPLGPEEPVIVHLMKKEKEYTVVFNHISGRTKVYEGYRK
jgi:general secretion pathway protein H